MATIKGDIFMGALAILPPATALAVHMSGIFFFPRFPLAIKTLLAVAHASLLYYGIYPYFTSSLRPLPTPLITSFFLGHAQAVTSQPPGYAFKQRIETVPNSGLIHCTGYLHFGSAIFVTTPEAVMEVLNTRAYDYEKLSVVRKILSMILGHGLINAEGAEHKRQRKNVAPAFSGRHIKDLVPLFWKKAGHLNEAIKREAVGSNGSLEVTDIISRATLDIIGSACIGKDFGTLDSAEHELAAQYSALFASTGSNDMLIYFIVNEFLPDWLARRIPLRATVKTSIAAAGLRKITNELLDEKKENTTHTPADQNDIIAILMRTGNFDDEGLIDQLLTFLAAGHETTSSSLSWALYLLATHPTIQTHLRAEIRSQLSPKLPPDMTADTLDTLPYLAATISEVFRLYPTVPLTSRVNIRPTRLAGTLIPTGTEIAIVPWALNRYTAIWGADADVFRPERWLGEDGVHGGATNPRAFLTFLHGPRSCIGQGFARYEMKALLAGLISKFEFAMAEGQGDPVPDGMFTIKPKGGLRLRVREVEEA